jgi:hypothetical protein
VAVIATSAVVAMTLVKVESFIGVSSELPPFVAE